MIHIIQKLTVTLAFYVLYELEWKSYDTNTNCLSLFSFSNLQIIGSFLPFSSCFMCQLRISSVLPILFTFVTWIPWKLVFPSCFISWKSPFLILAGSAFYQIWLGREPIALTVMVNSHQRWKQTRNRVCFHLWCELTLVNCPNHFLAKYTSC